jgi:hypothetical protein
LASVRTDDPDRLPSLSIKEHLNAHIFIRGIELDDDPRMLEGDNARFVVIVSLR